MVYLYVCMREDHLYIELIEQVKQNKQKKNFADAVVFADTVEDDCGGGGGRGRGCPREPEGPLCCFHGDRAPVV